MSQAEPTSSYATRCTIRQDVLDMTTSLVAEFAGQLPAGTVIAYVARAREQLARSGLRAELTLATEAVARQRLAELTPAHRSA
jgi:hypothetical protein